VPRIEDQNSLDQYICSFVFSEEKKPTLFSSTPPEERRTTIREEIDIGGERIPRYINEFWTSRQRQASSLHELSYRACFKPQLPRYFIQLFTDKGDQVYDPFAGRGTTALEGALQGRIPVSNDINPLGEILARPRLAPPRLEEVEARLEEIPLDSSSQAEIDLSMFFHPHTEGEIVSLQKWLSGRSKAGNEDNIDRWIRMVATNRLTGHSPGFFSVYSLPPNQAVSAERQRKINEKRGQKPEYRPTRDIIVKKTRSLLRDVKSSERETLKKVAPQARFLCRDARNTEVLPGESIQLIVTSPPFLDVVQYSDDNWLRLWFNGYNAEDLKKEVTLLSRVEKWAAFMQEIFQELFRVVRRGGWVAFEVGEVKGGKVSLDEYVVPAGKKAGFNCAGILVNQQDFTKTSNIWGINNNDRGTNTNRIVLFQKK